MWSLDQNLTAVRYFSAIELFALVADRNWLDDATKTIGQFWKRNNACRIGVTEEHQSGEISCECS